MDRLLTKLNKMKNDQKNILIYIIVKLKYIRGVQIITLKINKNTKYLAEMESNQF